MKTRYVFISLVLALLLTLALASMWNLVLGIAAAKAAYTSTSRMDAYRLYQFAFQKNDDGHTFMLYLQNPTAAEAIVVLSFRDLLSDAHYEIDRMISAQATLAIAAERVPELPDGLSYSLVVRSDQPVESVVRTHRSGSSGDTLASYRGVSGGSMLLHDAWSGDITTSTNPVSITMDADKTVPATVGLKTYVITPTAGAGGIIAPSTPQIVNHGEDITFTIAANAGYHTVDVLVDGISQGAIPSYTFSNVTADHTIRATFALSIRPEITSADHVTFVVGKAGTFTVTATGIPTPTIALSGTVPGGVAFTDKGDGTATLSGAPAVGSAGEYVLTFTASNGVAPDGAQAFRLTVKTRVCLPLVTRAREPAIVKVVPTTATVGVGAHLSISIVIDNATDLGSFEFQLSFDPSVVHAQGAEVSDFVGSTGRPVLTFGPDIDNDAGTVALAALSLGCREGPSGTGVLATVAFEAVGAGSSPLNLDHVDIFDRGGASQAATVQKGSVTVVAATTCSK